MCEQLRSIRYASILLSWPQFPGSDPPVAAASASKWTWSVCRGATACWSPSSFLWRCRSPPGFRHQSASSRWHLAPFLPGGPPRCSDLCKEESGLQMILELFPHWYWSSWSVISPNLILGDKVYYILSEDFSVRKASVQMLWTLNLKRYCGLQHSCIDVRLQRLALMLRQKIETSSGFLEISIVTQPSLCAMNHGDSEWLKWIRYLCTMRLDLQPSSSCCRRYGRVGRPTSARRRAMTLPMWPVWLRVPTVRLCR